MSELSFDGPVFLSTLRAEQRQARMAWSVVLVSVLVLLAAAPFAKTQLTPVWGFIPVYQSAVVVNDLATAVLLAGQFAIVRSPALLVLASGYLFTAAMATGHMLTFPGLFAPSGLLGAGTHSTAWMYMFWHAGFPIAVLFYVGLKNRRRSPISRPGLLVLAAAVTTAGLAAALTALATAGQQVLPPIMQGQRSGPALYWVIYGVWGLSLAALVVLLRVRERSVLDVWLVAVMVAWLCEVALAAMLNGGRFDLGYYVGRIYGLLAATFVLMVLLLENGSLYAQLGQAHALERQRASDLQKVNDKLESVNAMLDESNHRLQQASQFKSEFLASMTHELRTPLNAIIGFSELLRDGVAGPLLDKQKRFAGLIFDGGQHLLSLINDVLDLSKVEAGRMTLERKEIQLDSYVRGCLAMFDEPSRRRGLQLRYEPHTQGCVLADPRKVKQIVYNLLSNAVKFTPDNGTITLSVRRVPRESVNLAQPGMNVRLLALPPGEEPEMLQITVRDTGPGMANDDLALLFEPFRQVRTRAIEGSSTGLGLALVNRLAVLHGGTVGVASAPGRGTTFVVWIPWCTAGIVLAAPPVSRSTRAASTRRALVIEDDATAAELLRTHLEGAGFDVRCITDASQIPADGQPVPDVITLDILLPGTSGWDVLEQLKKDPVLAEVPVVIVSVIADKRKGVALGAAHVLQKPLTRQALLSAVQAVSAHSGTPRKVLVVDDDLAAVELVATNLQEADCEVLRAHDGADAIRMAKETQPELIILDLMMPGVSGFEVVDAVRRDSSMASVPIFVMTSKTITAEDRARLNGRVQHVMDKSTFDRDRFLGEVDRALRDPP